MDNTLRRMRENEEWNSDGVEVSGLNLNFNHRWHSDMSACVSLRLWVLHYCSWGEKESPGKEVILKEEEVGLLNLDQKVARGEGQLVSTV